MQYRKKPVVIEAEVYHEGLEDGWEYEDKLPTLTPEMFAVSKVDGVRLYPYIMTLEGKHFISKGDYIIIGIKGERYPCKPDIFEQTYEIAIERPKIICLCGSSRFIWYFAVMAWNFEKQGAITLGLHLLPENYTIDKVHEDHIAEWEGVAAQMDELHRRKIDLCDEVFVINVDGYIGKSTAGEIEYAKKLGKPIRYLEALKE